MANKTKSKEILQCNHNNLNNNCNNKIVLTTDFCKNCGVIIYKNVSK